MIRPKVLIADDEADIAMIIKLQLEDLGYATLRARDGQEVLELLQREEFGLVLLDIRMPRMDGLQALARIVVEYPDTAVIMMTAHGNEAVAVEAMKQGAVDYVAKPFSFDDLQKRVERALQFRETRRENLRLQQLLAAEQQKTAAILHGMADILLAVDRDGLIMLVNREGEDAFVRPREQLVGMPVDQVVHASIAVEQLPCLEALKSGQPVRDVAYTLEVKGGKVPVLSSATPLLVDGTVLGSVEIIRDISTLKALEQEKEDFVSMLSHDLKSPITAIVGSIDLVRERRLGPVNDEQREFLDDAVESCSELVDMIDTLLDIHKFEAGRMIMHFRQEDPLQALQRVIARYRVVAKRSGVTMVINSDAQPPMVQLDKNKYSRLAANLLANAFKFTPESGNITIRLERVVVSDELRQRIPCPLYPGGLPVAGDEYFLLAVDDTGPGIPADSLTAIFDRFVQAKSRQRGKTKGTGLGLAFCRKVMDVHQGYIWAESVEGQGSTFTALFPLDAGAKGP
jgi:PAS domain S-box-containing protein